MKKLKPRHSIKIIGIGATVLIVAVVLVMLFAVFSLFTGQTN